MTDFANAFLLVYAGLFPIINPVGNAPIFLGLTSSCTEAERNALARRVAINSMLLLAGAMFIGTHLLVFFGITLPVVRIAGGLVLIAFAWKLLHNGAELEDQRSAEASKPLGARRFLLSIDDAAHGRPRVDLGRHRIGEPASRRTARNIAVGATRRIGHRRNHRAVAYGLCLLPFRHANNRLVRRQRYQCRCTFVRLHSPVHRHSGAVDRLQHAGTRAATLISRLAAAIRPILNSKTQNGQK